MFSKEVLESVVYYHAKDFPKVTVNTDSTVIIGVEFVATFVERRYQSLVPNTGKDPRAKDNVKKF